MGGMGPWGGPGREYRQGTLIDRQAEARRHKEKTQRETKSTPGTPSQPEAIEAEPRPHMERCSLKGTTDGGTYGQVTRTQEQGERYLQGGKQEPPKAIPENVPYVRSRCRPQSTVLLETARGRDNRQGAPRRSACETASDVAVLFRRRSVSVAGTGVGTAAMR